MSCVANDQRHPRIAVCPRSLLMAIAIFAMLYALSAQLSYVDAAQQAATATLSGRIVDPNRAVLSGAQITATQKSTGVRRETKTNDEGLYVLTNLPVGDYEVRIQYAAFGTRVLPATLRVGQEETVDTTLYIAAANVHYDVVSDSVSAINTESAVVDGIVSQREIENHPLNGRNFLELALLIPGNSPAPNYDPTKTNTIVISSAGQLGRGGNVTVDGTD